MHDMIYHSQMLKYFTPITYAQAQETIHSIAQQTSIDISTQKAQKQQKQLEARGPGRPKKQLNMNEVLSQIPTLAQPSTKKRKRSYHNWFHPLLIHDIIHAVSKYRSARLAVDHLKRSFPQLPTESEGRFEALNESTVRTWFDDDWKILPKYADFAKPFAPGGSPVFEQCPEVEKEIKDTLLVMRGENVGIQIGITTIKWTMQAIIQLKNPQLLDTLKLSKGFISKWTRDQMQWSWRTSTSAASKLPLDWMQLGIDAAKRIAVQMEINKVHPSLVINFDQTGINLVPTCNKTYEMKGSKTVGIVANDDKRQITAVVASSLSGDLLPLQLIYQGKTKKSVPESTPDTITAGFHLTFSENHWSNQETMRQYLEFIIVPYVKQKIIEHNLPSDSKVVLVLDVWSVHKSEEFRTYIKKKHGNTNLVFVPANCTSKLQVADVVLQRPFKHGIKKRFNDWAAQVVSQQIQNNNISGIKNYLKMKQIKPLTLGWITDTWKQLKLGSKELVLKGWNKCVVSLYDVYSDELRKQAVSQAAKTEFVAFGFIPEEEDDEEENAKEDEDIATSDEEKDELDVMREITIGQRRSTRSRSDKKQIGGYFIDSTSVYFNTTDDGE